MKVIAFKEGIYDCRCHIIIVSASAASPAETRAIAEAVIEVASEELKELDCEASPVTLELLSSADLSTVASSPAPRRTYILGLLGGLVVGYGTTQIGRASCRERV